MINLIRTEEDVKKLENLLASYTKNHIGSTLPQIDLLKAFKKLHSYDNHGSRIFSALVDLKMNFTLLLIDNFLSGALWNEQYSIKIPDAKNILDYPDLFNKRFEIHRHNANYIPRYRAIWDKVMGILLLIESEEKYNKYNSSKSRKKSFLNLTKDTPFFEKGFVENILKHIQEFDDTFRTSEIHRFGSLRKYSFLQNPLDKKEFIFLRSSWNQVMCIIIDIDKLIEAIKPPFNYD